MITDGNDGQCQNLRDEIIDFLRKRFVMSDIGNTDFLRVKIYSPGRGLHVVHLHIQGMMFSTTWDFGFETDDKVELKKWQMDQLIKELAHRHMEEILRAIHNLSRLAIALEREK